MSTRSFLKLVTVDRHVIVNERQIMQKTLERKDGSFCLYDYFVRSIYNIYVHLTKLKCFTDTLINNSLYTYQKGLI